MVQALKNAKVIAYPTESVFGLGCDPDSETAVHALLELKKRSWGKGLILIAAKYEQLLPYIDRTKLSEKKIEQLFSYNETPITWIIPAKITTPRWLIGHFSTIAVRVSHYSFIQILCSEFGKPIVSTSANLSGLKPCRTAQEVRLQFGDDLLLIDEAVGTSLQPSEIRDALTNQLFRQG
ncbi:Sua5/YciO/YrdC/YwlC family protein [Candidatus Profftia tarda]|nr:Sua5/YciO/YrdC/YwlC family protein [Candidatus Profftia tarda]